jgi:hypothetical protein
MPHHDFLIIEALIKYYISLSLMIRVLNSHLLRQQNNCQIRHFNCNAKNKNLNSSVVLVPERLSGLQTPLVCGSPTKGFVVISEYPVVTQQKNKRKSKLSQLSS